MKAIYALSADPITYGHIDVVLRAASIFKEVIVAIGTNSDKTYIFNKTQRVQMAIESFSKFPAIKVVSIEGLLVDYAYEQHIPVIIRGIRNSSDYEYEKRLALCGETQGQGIDTFLLMASPSMEHITSSTVKAILKSGGYIDSMVPLHVKFELEKTMSDRFIIGITGEIGVGKSHVTEKLIKELGTKERPAYNIDLDKISHDILDNLSEPVYRSIRNDIAHAFYSKVDGYNGSIDRTKLGEIVFSDPSKMQVLNSIMVPAMLTRIKREIGNKKGIFLLNSALLVEAGWNKICNNNVILVECNDDIQLDRLANRGHDEKEIERRIGAQLQHHEKYSQLREIIKLDNYGHTYSFDNNIDNRDEMFRVIKSITNDLIDPHDALQFYTETNDLL